MTRAGPRPATPADRDELVARGVVVTGVLVRGPGRAATAVERHDAGLEDRVVRHAVEVGVEALAGLVDRRRRAVVTANVAVERIRRGARQTRRTTARGARAHELLDRRAVEELVHDDAELGGDAVRRAAVRQRRRRHDRRVLAHDVRVRPEHELVREPVDQVGARGSEREVLAGRVVVEHEDLQDLGGSLGLQVGL